jgi:hypothetical protein
MSAGSIVSSAIGESAPLETAPAKAAFPYKDELYGSRFDCHTVLARFRMARAGMERREGVWMRG